LDAKERSRIGQEKQHPSQDCSFGDPVDLPTLPVENQIQGFQVVLVFLGSQLTNGSGACR